MIRVLHVVGTLEYGGTESFIMNMYRKIDRSTVQFDFLVLNKNEYPYIQEIKELGGNIYFGKYPNYKKLYSSIITNLKVLKKNKYEVIHCHINIMNAWLVLLGKLAHIPIRISHSHGVYGKEGNFIKRIIHSVESIMIKCFSTDYLSCSAEAGYYLYGTRFFQKKGMVINNGIEVEKFISKTQSGISLRNEFNIPEDCSIIIGNISRFDSIKNQLFLIDIFNIIVKKEPNAVLVLGGVDGGLLEECKKKVLRLKLSEKVRFIGKRNDMAEVLNLIDIFILPSLHEGLGMVLLEAQASNCYCVASANCPVTSDMGLGMIDFYPLWKSPSEWATFIMDNYHNCKKNENRKIIDAFESNNYTVSKLVEVMTSLYLGKEH